MPEVHVKLQLADPHSQSFSVGGRIEEFSFLRNSEVILMLLVWKARIVGLEENV